MLPVDLAAVRSEIEREREWREAELRFFKNRVAELRKEDERVVARKALVVMLYAHFEGLTKALFTIYVNSLNKLGITVSQAQSSLAATTLIDVFKALRNPTSKCKVFRRKLPNDAKLHRYARDREFLERTADFGAHPLTINADSVVDTESNLKPVVIRKILYQLGFDPSLVDPWEGNVNLLLQKRNDIAHGTAQSGIQAKDYESMEKGVKEVIDDIVKVITEHLSGQSFLASKCKHVLGGGNANGQISDSNP